jgi:hypothetical protein
MLWIETGLVLASLLVACIYPSLGSRWFEKLEWRLSQLSRRRVLSIVLVGVTALVLRAALLPILPVPEPIVHDEFGYLLAADTFAHGRLTNPTHPMWVHFETFHVIHQPTYCTKYFPAQGMFLALGQVVFGHPFWGVWLSAGLMCAAITWMLQGWLSTEWALLGGILAVFRYGVFGYWANSYWGGSVAAIGGALVLGTLPRIKEYRHVRHALLMGIGLALLASSRPWEGFVFSLPVGVLLFAWVLGRNRPKFKMTLRRVVLPLAAMLALTTACTGYYFWRTTGSPFRMPYEIDAQTYGVAPYMLWQHVRPVPAYRYEVLRKMYVGEELVGYYVFRSPIGFLLKTYMAWSFFLGPVLTLPFLMLAVALPRNFSWRSVDRSTRSLLFVLCIFALGSVFATFYSPHYSAPATGLLLALILLMMRQIRDWSPAGLFLTRAIPLICVVAFVLRAAADPLRIPLNGSRVLAWYQPGPKSFGKAFVESELYQVPGKHLVIVHYKPNHEPFEEWVYNEADIDRARIVWAREMDSKQNQELIDYFKDRQAWLLDADSKPPKLTPYPKQIDAIAASCTGSRYALGLMTR